MSDKVDNAIMAEMLADPAFAKLVHLVPTVKQPTSSDEQKRSKADEATTVFSGIEEDKTTPEGINGGFTQLTTSVDATLPVGGLWKQPLAIKQHKQRKPLIYKNIDLSTLWDDDTKLRPHPPIPELDFDSYESCVEFYETWGRENAVAFVRSKWQRNILGERYKCEVRCAKQGSRKRATSRNTTTSVYRGKKTGCPFAFYIVAIDYRSIQDSRWRILHMAGKKNLQKSLMHNHPPSKNTSAALDHLQSWHPDAIRAKFRSYLPTSSSAEEILGRLQKDLPGVKVTSHDVMNEFLVAERDGVCMQDGSGVHSGQGVWTETEVPSEQLKGHVRFYWFNMPPVSGQAKKQDVVLQRKVKIAEQPTDIVRGTYPSIAYAEDERSEAESIESDNGCIITSRFFSVGPNTD